MGKSSAEKLYHDDDDNAKQRKANVNPTYFFAVTFTNTAPSTSACNAVIFVNTDPVMDPVWTWTADRQETSSTVAEAMLDWDLLEEGTPKNSR